MMNIKYWTHAVVSFCLLALWHTVAQCASEPFDLATWMEDCVLETRQIMVPGYPGAFNASIVRWKEKLLLCFRVRDKQEVSTFDMGFVWLNDNFQAMSTPHILEIRDDNPLCLQRRQDPRLMVIKDKLYIIYSNFITIDDMITRRMFIAEVHCEDDRFFIERPICLHPFDGCSKRWEKNWVPFVYEDTLLLAYSLVPHRIFQPLLPSGICDTQNVTTSVISWRWGDLRGGTPAVKDGDEYIAFFHSSDFMTTTYSHGKKMTHYVMGAYTFSAEPPFEIRRISRHPIVGPGFYSGPIYNTWKPLRVVFPMGIIMDEDYIWITYGRQDFEIWIAKIDKKKLYQSMISCEPLADDVDMMTCQKIHDHDRMSEDAVYQRS
jgi:predicted GH43/DUF377 family glycosyl hydrolase